MSNVNIERLVKNIKSNTTTIYTPIIEIIVNAIQAIEEKGNIEKGEIKVIVKRNAQAELALDGSIPAIESIVITDNGIGFTDENKESFDTLYGDHKIQQGGKGFGRFICLKYFKDLHVESVYLDSTGYKKINFSMGKRNNIIVDEKVVNSSLIVSGTSIHLDYVRNSTLLNKKLSTISGILVEKLLPYFITKDYTCPTITLVEENDSGKTILNDYINHNSSSIKEVIVEKDTFSLGNNQNTHEFKIRVFKIYSPKGQVSKVSLVADKRGVTDISISSYIPEFVEEFYDKRENGSDIPERNYIIKVYVFGEYLDKNVSLERGGFEFQKENDFIYGISQVDIERKATELTKEAVVDDISLRQEKKEKRISSYVEEEAPWHKELLNKIDLSSFPYNSSNEDIEVRLQKEKFQKEVAIRNEINILLKNDSNVEFEETILEIVEKISESSKNDLIHYIALRRRVIDLFGKSLEKNNEGRYASESSLHNIIFPMRKDSEAVKYDKHNLWIIDERLNFTSYLSSDLPLDGGITERPDIISYNRPVAFRGDNESSNPVIIFEFKKPERDDFANPSSKEDPVDQIIRYVNNIREGKFKTPQGRKINIAANTPFYGYVVCELSTKIETWLEDVKDFRPMPDRMGWFQWREKINLYMEVISWEKLLKDADMRNKMFFHKLGI